MTNEQVDRLSRAWECIHPLLQVLAQAELDRRCPLDHQEYDLGTWDGRCTLLCEREWLLREQLGLSLSSGSEHHVDAVQAARKEYHYNKMDPVTKKLYDEAAVTGWNRKVYLDNQAVEVLDMKTSERVRRDLAQRGELDRIMKPRFVLTELENCIT